MSVQWIEHKGKRILYSDHRGQTPHQITEGAELSAKLAREVLEPEKILFLTDLEGAVVDIVTLAKIKQLGKEVYEPKCEKTAIVGIHGLNHMLLSAYNRVTGAGENQKLFDTQEEALEWLVS